MFNSIILGILQGITEWLPVSSQGNLVLAMVGLFDYSQQKALELSVFLHAGTLLAALIYFRKQVRQIISGLKDYKFNFQASGQNKIISFLLLSTILTGITGGLLFSALFSFPFQGEIFIAIVGLGLIFTGIFQKIARGKTKCFKTKESLCLKDSILLGVCQGFSAIPGISRSGITTCSFLFLNYKPETALELSFLMSIPAVLGAEIGIQLLKGAFSANLADGFLGLFFSFCFGLLTIHLFLKIAKKTIFWIFCVVLGCLALIPLIFYI